MQHGNSQHDNSKRSPRIAIIGAGMAGISCAHALRQQDFSVTLFEKSRGVGGRLATRRNDAGDRFDHGAQYITTQSSAFTHFSGPLQNQGAAAEWQPRLSDAMTTHHPWFVGTTGMNALLKPLLKDLDVRTGTTITALQQRGSGWQLHAADGALPDSFDAVISTAPSVQAHALLAVEPAMQQPLEAVTMAPCWTVMITFRTPLDVDFDARRFDDGAIAWLARQASRPAPVESRNAWVVHASAGWSTEHLELAPEQAFTILQQQLFHAIGQAPPEISFAQAHRWRHAMTTQPLGRPFLANDDHSLFAGGDWCLGARVECAYQSGVAIAAAVANKLHV